METLSVALNESIALITQELELQSFHVSFSVCHNMLQKI